MVFEDLSLKSGENKWDKFSEIIQSSKTTTIRITSYHSKGENAQLFFKNLSFNHSTYSIYEKDRVI